MVVSVEKTWDISVKYAVIRLFEILTNNVRECLVSKKLLISGPVRRVIFFFYYG